ncbi:caltractin [Acrasis kona]|uniref:Caltractin n=1 Tax=Acrasis kona TaxID=1008807 RepID=A0AAW2Z6I5_9EUKA
MATLTKTRDPKIIKSIIKKYDTDGNSKIDVKEFGNLVKDLGYKFTDENVQAFLMLIDTDGSGYIDQEEFITWWSNETFHTDKIIDLITQAAAIFKKFDVDNSKKISRSEFTALAKEVVQLDDSIAQDKLFQQIDQSKDKEIQFAEFCKWLKWF